MMYDDIDDTHYSVCMQIMIDKGLKEDEYEYEDVDEYEVISDIDKNAIFGELQEVEKEIYPIVITENITTEFKNKMMENYNKLYVINEKDEIIEYK